MKSIHLYKYFFLALLCMHRILSTDEKIPEHLHYVGNCLCQVDGALKDAVLQSLFYKSSLNTGQRIPRSGGLA